MTRALTVPASFLIPRIQDRGPRTWMSVPCGPGLRLALLLCCVAGPLFGRQVAPFAQTPLDPYTPLVGSQAEMEAFRAIGLERRAVDRVSRIDTFLESFAESELVYLVLHERWRAVSNLRMQPEEIIASASEGLEAAEYFLGTRLSAARVRDERYFVAERELTELKSDYYRSMASASRRLGDLSAMSEYTDRAVETGRLAWEQLRLSTDADTEEYQRQSITHRAVEVTLLRDAMLAFGSAGDRDGVLGYGSRVLEVDPADLLTLMVLSSALIESGPEAAPPDEQLSMAMNYAFRALDRLGSDSVPALTPAQRITFESSIRATLGGIYYYREAYVEAEDALHNALLGLPRDVSVHNRLGLVYAKTDRLSDAAAAFARAAYLASDDAAGYRREVWLNLETVYLLLNGTLDGIEDFVALEGARLDLQ